MKLSTVKSMMGGILIVIQIIKVVINQEVNIITKTNVRRGRRIVITRRDVNMEKDIMNEENETEKVLIIELSRKA